MDKQNQNQKEAEEEATDDIDMFLWNMKWPYHIIPFIYCSHHFIHVCIHLFLVVPLPIQNSQLSESDEFEFTGDFEADIVDLNKTKSSKENDTDNCADDSGDKNDTEENREMTNTGEMKHTDGILCTDDIKMLDVEETNAVSAAGWGKLI